MKYIFFLFCFTMSSLSYGQYHTNLSRSELGLMVGGSYYIGDLNRFAHFRQTQLAGGIIYRYNIHPRLSFRGNFMYGNVMGSDALAKDELLKNRNLNFKSDIFELAGGLEFSYFPFQLGNPKYRATAYLIAQIGMFKMNPKTYYDGEWIELQPVGTEGQGSDLNSKKKYPLYQLTIPLGVGAKFALGKKVTFSVEYGIRKTFTDYLDDVKADSYQDFTRLEEANGPLAATLSNRSLDGNNYGKRGTSATKDWYAFFGASFTFRLGMPKKCMTN